MSGDLGICYLKAGHRTDNGPGNPNRVELLGHSFPAFGGNYPVPGQNGVPGFWLNSTGKGRVKNRVAGKVNWLLGSKGRNLV